MEVKAHLRHLLIAPRKVRLVVDIVRGLPVSKAIDQLTAQPKAAALPVMKLIKSAMANARHNFKLDPDHLYVKSIVANEGPRLKRFRARAFGRAANIQKRMSHISLILAEQPGHSHAPSVKTEAVKAKLPTIAKSDIKGVPSEPKLTKPSTTQPPTGPNPERQRAAQDAAVSRKGES